MSFGREERTGGHYPGLVVLLSPEDNNRLGYNQPVNLKEGDLAMCCKHSGDCFWDYKMIKLSYDSDHQLRFTCGVKFSAYVLGTPYYKQPTEREFHLLMAGETTALTGKVVIK
jgi:hypothetical protein